MKTKLLSFAMLSLAVSAFAQQDFFALTGKNTSNIVFSDFRTLDVEHGVSGQIIFSSESSSKVFSQVQNRIVNEEKTSFNNAQSTSMASLALDGQNGKLVYIPMFSSNVYVLDQKTQDITLVESMAIKSFPCDIGSHITRMTAGYDGNIYAMSNSGSQLIQISGKDGKYTVVDLGMIKDDSSNGANSIKEVKIGYGGDMVADIDNNFFVFSASGNVFKVSPKLMIAKFLGKISGFPENYSLNGAAVNAKGNIVTGSAVGGSMYEISLNDLQAKPIAGNLHLPIYDLASQYFIGEKLVANATSGVEIFPTKVDEDFFNLRIDDPKIKGSVTVEIYDFSGIKILQKTIPSIEKNRMQKIDLNNLKSGIYLVSVLSGNKKIILNTKIAVK
jgi:hypothetical protein